MQGNTDKRASEDLRSRGEAHLYVAVAKSDGIVSGAERQGASYHAGKSQDLFDVMKINRSVKRTIKENVNKILNDKNYAGWTATRHLDEAVENLKKAGGMGDWGVRLSAAKNEKGLTELALLDGYTIKESGFLKEIFRRLDELK